MSIHDQPFNTVLDVAQIFDESIAQWSQEYLDNWVQNYPGLVDVLLVDYGYDLLTHPGISTASSEDRALAYDIFDHYLSYVGSYAEPQLMNTLLYDFSYNGDLEGLSLVVQAVTPEQVERLNPLDMGWVLNNIVAVQENWDGETDYYQMAADAARDFMEKIGDVVDIVNWGINQALKQFSAYQNLAGIDAITDNLTAQQINQLNPLDMGDVLNNIVAVQENWDGGVTDYYQMAADAARDFMEKIGDVVDIVNWGINQALKQFSAYQNLAGIDAITDNLTAEQIDQLNPLDMGQVLDNILAVQGNWDGGVTDYYQMAADGARDFMEKIGDVVNVGAIDGALRIFSSYQNLAGIDAITDNLTAQQIDQLNPVYMGDVLNNIVAIQWNWDGGVTDYSQMAADGARDFMEKVGDVVNVVNWGISEALKQFSTYQNLAGIDAITDNLTAQQINQLNPVYMGDVLGNIVSVQENWGLDDQGNPVDYVQVAADAARDFMEKVGDVVDVGAINDALVGFSQYWNFDGIDAIVDNISDEQVSQLNPHDLQSQGMVLGTDGVDYIYGDGSESVIHGRDGDDAIIGGDGDTVLFGGDGNDAVYDFGNGNDIISGGDGSDYLYGGVGADTFVFKQGETGKDFLYFLNVNEGDKLDLSDYLEQYNPLQDAIDDFVILTQKNTQTVTVSVDVDGNGAGQAVEIVDLYAPTGAITAQNIVDTEGVV